MIQPPPGGCRRAEEESKRGAGGPGPDGSRPEIAGRSTSGGPVAWVGGQGADGLRTHGPSTATATFDRGRCMLRCILRRWSRVSRETFRVKCLTWVTTQGSMSVLSPADLKRR